MLPTNTFGITPFLLLLYVNCQGNIIQRKHILKKFHANKNNYYFTSNLDKVCKINPYLS